MNHEAMHQLLSAYVDQELTESEIGMVEEHLNGCSDCRLRAHQLVTLKRNVHSAGNIDLPYAFASVLAHSIDRKEETNVSWVGIERYAQRFAIGLSFLVLVLLGITGYRQHDDPVTVERYVVGVSSDSAGSQILTKQGTITRDDVMLAVFTK